MFIKYIAILIVGIGIGWGLCTHFKPVVPTVAETSSALTPKLDAAAITIKPEAKPLPINIKTTDAVTKTARDLKIIKDDFDSAMNSEKTQKVTELLEEMEKTGGKDSLQYLESKSRYLVRTRDYDKAKEVLDRCVQLFPASKSCLVDNADVALSLGTKDDQEKAITSCLAKFPTNMQCRNQLAILRMNQGQYPLAVTIYEELIRDNGSYGVRFPEWLLDSQIGTALEGSGRLREAANHFDRSCRSGQNENACMKFNELRTRL